MYMMASLCVNQCMVIWNQHLGLTLYGNTEVCKGSVFTTFCVRKGGSISMLYVISFPLEYWYYDAYSD